MTTHKTGTREEWLAARLELLDTEKEQSPTACIIDPVAARLAPRAASDGNPCGGMPPPHCPARSQFTQPVEEGDHAETRG